MSAGFWVMPDRCGAAPNLVLGEVVYTRQVLKSPMVNARYRTAPSLCGSRSCTVFAAGQWLAPEPLSVGPDAPDRESRRVASAPFVPSSLANRNFKPGAHRMSALVSRADSAAPAMGPVHLRSPTDAEVWRAAVQCQLPTSGEPPLTSAVEPSRSSNPSDGSCPHCGHCQEPVAGSQWGRHRGRQGKARQSRHRRDLGVSPATLYRYIPAAGTVNSPSVAEFS
jgi:hypothetical protein